MSSRSFKGGDAVRIINVPPDGEKWRDQVGKIETLPERNNFFFTVRFKFLEPMLAMKDEMRLLSPLELLAECADTGPPHRGKNKHDARSRTTYKDNR